MKKPEDMTTAEIDAEIDALQMKHDRIAGRLGALKICLAVDACPYRVGEVLVNQYGERARIDEIKATQRYREKYKLSGVYLKADGTPKRNPGRNNDTLRFCNFNQWDKWRRPE